MKDTYCPRCFTHLILNDNIENARKLRCSSCSLEFGNPHFKKPTIPIQNPFTFKSKINIESNQRYFINPVLLTIILITSVIILLYFYFTNPLNLISSNDECDNFSDCNYSTNKVNMEENNGNYYINICINGISIKSIFDTGASNISMSLTEARFFVKQGKITPSDIISTTTYATASGDVSIGTVVNLKCVKIGDTELNNIEAIVVNNINAPFLLGQTALSKFVKISIDYKEMEIQFN